MRRKNKLLIILPALFIGLLIFSCMKSSDPCQNTPIAQEDPVMRSYIDTSGMKAQSIEGMYYQILTPGNDNKPSDPSKIRFTYTLSYMLTDGQAKYIGSGDNTDPNVYQAQILGYTILGWRLSMPLIGEGGRIKMVIPSAYGYGCNGAAAIPPNAILLYDVQLVSVQN